MGIGRDINHSLVEDLARVGKGFAQIVSDGKEGMGGKVVCMLRGGLSVHIKDSRLEWDGRPTEAEQIQTLAKEKTPASLKRTVDGVRKKISLFNKQADLDTLIFSSSPADRFSHLPEFNVPSVLQAPHQLPPLFPFKN